MNRPRVTIGLPVYNGEAYLAEAIDSLLAQDFDDFELVISDNASTDGTQAICRSYAAADSRVRYERHEQNRGAHWNFYRVLDVARGEFFRWAADDDICDPTLLRRCVDVLDRDPEVVWCHAQTREIDAAGKPIPDKPLIAYDDPEVLSDPPLSETEGARNPERRLQPHQRFRELLMGSAAATRAYGLVRTDAIRQTRRVTSYYGWEKPLFAELCLFGRYHEIPEPLFFMRIHENASSNLGTALEQQYFSDPARESSTLMARVGHVPGYVRAVLRAPINFRNRICCLWWTVRYVLQVSKWKRVWLSIVRKTGAGGVHHHMFRKQHDEKTAIATCRRSVSSANTSHVLSEPRTADTR